MQLEDSSEIPKVAQRSNFCIFELPKGEDLTKIFPNDIHVRKLEDKREITKDLIDDVIKLAAGKQSKNFNIVVENAELMNIKAANCILKNLEEPGQFIHYIFLTYNSGYLLPTIRSRAFCYKIKSKNKITDPPITDPDMLKLAKRYVSAKGADLVAIANEVTKSKRNTRDKAVDLVNTSIELMYKSYFATGNEQFLTKLEKLLKAHEGLQANGNIKLQLVANML